MTTANSLETMLVEALNNGKTSATDLNSIIQNEVLKIPNKQGTVEIRHIGWIKHKRKVCNIVSSGMISLTNSDPTTEKNFDLCQRRR